MNKPKDGSFSFLLPQDRDLLLQVGETTRYRKNELAYPVYTHTH